MYSTFSIHLIFYYQLSTVNVLNNSWQQIQLFLLSQNVTVVGGSIKSTQTTSVSKPLLTRD